MKYLAIHKGQVIYEGDVWGASFYKLHGMYLRQNSYWYKNIRGQWMSLNLSDIPNEVRLLLLLLGETP